MRKHKFMLPYAGYRWVVAAGMVAAITSGCAKDLILDMGNGDGIRLMGKANNFYCDDPEHAGVEKVETFTMAFADGTSRSLCQEKGAKPLRTFVDPVVTSPTSSQMVVVPPSASPGARAGGSKGVWTAPGTSAGGKR